MDAEEVPLGKEDDKLVPISRQSEPLQCDKRASDERRVASRDSGVICSLLIGRRTLATRAILVGCLRASEQRVK